MISVELSFPLMGDSVPIDSGYWLSAGLKNCLEGLGKDESVAHFLNDRTIGLHLLVRKTPFGEADLSRDSALRIRLAPTLIPILLPLAGRRLRVGPKTIQLGVPSVHGLTPATNLFARLATIKGFEEPGEFLAAAVRQLNDNGLADGVVIRLAQHPIGPHAGEPIRRVLHIRDKTIVGFAVEAQCATAKDSLRLQSIGLGGRRHFGAGVFIPKPHTAEASRA